MKLSRRRTLVTLAGAALVPAFACRGKGDRTQPVQPTVQPQSPILKVVDAVSATDGDGATVQRVFPTPALANLDPFVLLDDFDVRRPAGFPEHPHRGFEAFTYMLEGVFHHTDNLGNDSRIAAGGTQRFTSGRGARHSEMPGTNGPNRGLQLWVNLPRRLKGMDPAYEGISGENMPTDRGGEFVLRTVVGPRSPVALQTQVDYLDVEFVARGNFETDVESGRNTLLYALAGTLTVGGNTLGRGQGAVLGEGHLVVDAAPGARFAYLSGKPHREPIIHRGPYVD